MVLLIALLGCKEEVEASNELWDNPGEARTTASWAAATALADCQALHADDAHVVSVFRLPETSWSVTTYAESDPEQVCYWTAYIELDAEPEAQLLSLEAYDPEWSFSASDQISGWVVDSDAVMGDLGLPAQGFFWLTPAAHRAQSSEYADALAGYDDDHPVILAGEDLRGPGHTLVDGRSGDVIVTVE